ncbi:unnamed protein product [Urochloa humidicola]
MEKKKIHPTVLFEHIIYIHTHATVFLHGLKVYGSPAKFMIRTYNAEMLSWMKSCFNFNRPSFRFVLRSVHMTRFRGNL